MKLALAFLAGVMVMAVETYVAGVRFAAPMFIAGAVFVLAPLVGMLSSVKRIRATARFLLAFAQGLEGRSESAKQLAVVSREKSGYVKPSRKAQLQNMADTIEEYRQRSTARPAGGYSDATKNVLDDMFDEGKVA
jgi:hypothetical protein